MKYDFLMGKQAAVWFCTACDDQPPWKGDTLEKCPTCRDTENVVPAQRFGNLTS